METVRLQWKSHAVLLCLMYQPKVSSVHGPNLPSSRSVCAPRFCPPPFKTGWRSLSAQLRGPENI